MAALGVEVDEAVGDLSGGEGTGYEDASVKGTTFA